MINIYYLIAAIAYGIFIIQFILSWFGGDTDLDVDLDGNADFDVGDLVSFKGLIHFLMGAFGYLSLIQTNREITIFDYVFAFIIGVIFIIVLYYVYKLCMKLKYEPEPKDDYSTLVGKEGYTISKDNNQYNIMINNDGQYLLLKGIPETDKFFNHGEDIVITKVTNHSIYFKQLTKV